MSLSFMIQHATILNDHKTVERLLPRVDVNCRNPKNNETTLHVAAAFGSVTCAELLLENGADVDAISTNKETPLFKAISSQFNYTDKIVERLLQFNCKITNNILIALIDTDGSIAGYSEKCESVYRHILKRMAAEIFQDNSPAKSLVDYFKNIAKTNRAQFIKEHKTEVEKMKKLMLAPRLTAYDVIRDPHYFARYANHPIVKRYFQSKAYLTEFPLYADYLEISYKFACIRKPLIDEGEVALLETSSSCKTFLTWISRRYMLL